VVDTHGEDVGEVETAWLDTATGTVEFIGVMAHWLTSKVLPVPVARAEVHTDSRVIRLPYAVDDLKKGPRLAQHGTLTDDDKAAIYEHFSA
jgi:hypothetical protein